MRKQSDETGTTSTTVGASFMNWRGDVALGGNAQTQFNVGKDTQLTARANLNRSVPRLCLPPLRGSNAALSSMQPWRRTADPACEHQRAPAAGGYGRCAGLVLHPRAAAGSRRVSARPSRCSE